jgi:putative ABC transport system substrate-binding protein
MNRKLWLLPFLLCASLNPAEAQQPGKVPRIGYLSRGSGAGANEEIFRQGLRSLGYVEGQSIAIESRFAHEKLNRPPFKAGDNFCNKPRTLAEASALPTSGWLLCKPNAR